MAVYERMESLKAGVLYSKLLSHAAKGEGTRLVIGRLTGGKMFNVRGLYCSQSDYWK